MRITSYHLMYVSEDGATFAYVYGLGPKFYTKFADGTWLVSNTAPGIRDEKVIVQKREEEAAPAEEIWRKHHTKVQEYLAKGSQLARQVSFWDWLEMESRFDRSNVIPVVTLGVIWLVLLVWAGSWVVMNGSNIIASLFERLQALQALA